MLNKYSLIIVNCGVQNEKKNSLSAVQNSYSNTIEIIIVPKKCLKALMFNRTLKVVPPEVVENRSKLWPLEAALFKEL